MLSDILSIIFNIYMKLNKEYKSCMYIIGINLKIIDVKYMNLITIYVYLIYE